MESKIGFFTKFIKVNINTPEWVDMVFVGRNHAYGAYKLRQESSHRHMLALLIASAAFVGGIAGPGFIKSILPDREVKEESRVVELIDLKVPENKANDIIKDIPPPPPMRNTVKFTPPVIKADEEVPEDQEDLKSQKDLADATAAIGAVDFKDGTDDVEAPIATVKQEVVDAPEEVFVIVEQAPEFIGGDKALMKYLSDNLVYPTRAADEGVQGTVYLKFVVGNDGRIRDVVVLRGFDKSCEEAAVKVVRNMPAWKPGKQSGKSVSVSYTLPVRFVLKER